MIGAIIYVAGMFPLYYSYQYLGLLDYGLLDIIPTIGAFIVMAQAFFGVFDDKPKVVPAQLKAKNPSA